MVHKSTRKSTKVPGEIALMCHKSFCHSFARFFCSKNTGLTAYLFDMNPLQILIPCYPDTTEKLDRGWTKIAFQIFLLKGISCNSLKVNMLEAGLEPARDCSQGILSLLQTAIYNQYQ